MKNPIPASRIANLSTDTVMEFNSIAIPESIVLVQTGYNHTGEVLTFDEVRELVEDVKAQSPKDFRELAAKVHAIAPHLDLYRAPGGRPVRPIREN